MATTARPFVGRSDDLARIAVAIERVATGEGQVVVVEGQPGLGKTRLLDETADLARAAGLGVGRGACHDLELDRPLEPLLAALGLDTLDAEVAEAIDRDVRQLMLDDPTGTSYAPGRLIPLIDRVVDTVERRAADGPRTVLIDDVHWADQATLQALQAVANRSKGQQVLVVVSHRPLEANSDHRRVLESIVRGPAAHHLRLDALDDDAALTLAEQLLGARPGPRLAAAIARAGGNPLFIAELTEALSAAHEAVHADQVVELGTGELPSSFERLVLDRIRTFAVETWDLLSLATVLGSEFEPIDLAALSGATMPEVLRALRPVLNDGWLVESGDRLRFRHDLVRDAILLDIPRGIRVGLHRDAAEVLAERKAPVAAVAAHMLVGARPGEPEAVDVLMEAGKALAISNPPAALRYLEHGLALMNQDHDASAPSSERTDRHTHLLALTARAHVWAGDIDAARPLYEAVRSRDLPDDQRADMEEGFGEALFLHGRLDEAAVVFEELATSPISPNRALRRADLALCRAMSARLDEAVPEAELAIEVGQREGHERGLCEAYSVLSLCGSLQGRHNEARTHAERAVAIADTSLGRAGHRDIPLMFSAQAASFADRHGDAITAIDRGVEISRSIAMAWDQPIMASTKATELVLAGAWDDAAAEAEAVLAYSAETGVRVVDPYAHACLAHVARRRGELDAATRHVERGLRAASEGASQGVDLVLFEQVMVQGLASSESGEATARHAMNLWRAVTALGVRVRQRQFGPPMAQLLLDLDQHDASDRILRTLAGIDEAPSPAPGERAAAALARGLRAGDPEALREAIGLLEAVERTPESADAYATLAVTLAPTDERTAREAAEEATRRYEALGAMGDVTRLLARLQREGLTPRRQRTRRRAFGWDSLTPSEVRVVQGVAAGQTNREIAERLFVSRRTVESHLHHVYTKLGLSSRVQLATQAVEHELDRPDQGPPSRHLEGNQ